MAIEPLETFRILQNLRRTLKERARGEDGLFVRARQVGAM